jgi:phosphoglycolate phosphatase
LRAEKTILIGDTDHDAEVAEAIGCKAIIIPVGHQTRERIEIVSCTLLDSFGDLLHLVRGWESNS